MGRPLSRSHKRRKARRERIALGGQPPAPRTALKYILSPLAVQSNVLLSDLPVAKGAYSAVNEHYVGSKKKYTLDELLGDKYNFELLQWDGVYVWFFLHQRPLLILIAEPRGL